MDVSQELKNGFTDAIAERFKNPFLGSALLSWPIINHRLLLVMLGSGSYDSKIFYIDTYLYPRGFIEHLWYMAIAPTLTGLFFTLVFPIIDEKLTVRFIELSNSKKKKVMEAEEKTPFDSKEQAAFFLKWEKINMDLKSGLELSNKNWRTIYNNNEAMKNVLLHRLRQQVLCRIALEGGASEEITQFFLFNVISPGYVWASPGRADFLRNHPKFNQLQKVAKLIQESAAHVNNGTIYINFLDLEEKIPISETERPALIDMLYALDLITYPTTEEHQISAHGHMGDRGIYKFLIESN